MNFHDLLRFFRLVLALSVMTLLISCGGGGCDGNSIAFGRLLGESCANNQTTVITVISGVAGSEAPIVGKLEITDTQGVTRETQINEDGAYSVDVIGMTGPFVIKAEGTIAGVNVSYYSPATQEDVGSTVNITPFTNLLLSNIAGKSINIYLSDAKNIPLFASSLTPQKISQAQADLFTLLSPILVQLGVSETIDFIRTIFRFDQSGLNSLMYLVKVEINSTTSSVVLRNLISKFVLTSIDLTRSFTQTAIQQSLYAEFSTSSVADIQSISYVLRRFEKLFEGGSPTVESLANSGLFDTSTDFNKSNSNDQSFQQFAENLASDSDLIGAKFKSWSLDVFTPGSLATVRIRVLHRDRGNDKAEPEYLYFKKIGTSWRIIGTS